MSGKHHAAAREIEAMSLSFLKDRFSMAEGSLSHFLKLFYCAKKWFKIPWPIKNEEKKQASKHGVTA